MRDDGIGIPPDQLPQIFDLFAQVDRAHRRGQGGLGIGLTMVRSLVEMHGGTVEAHSAGPGQGSEFIVYLPHAADAAPTSNATQPSLPGASPLSGQRILIADDNRDAADSLGLLLEADGAEVRMVYDGRTVLAAMEAFRAQTVLLDLGMPEMDGYKVARQLREDERYQDVRIAALTD